MDAKHLLKLLEDGETGTLAMDTPPADMSPTPCPSDVPKSNFHNPLAGLPGVYWWGGHFPTLFRNLPKDKKKKKKDKQEGLNKATVAMKLLEVQFKFCKKCATMTPHQDGKCQMCNKAK